MSKALRLDAVFSCCASLPYSITKWEGQTIPVLSQEHSCTHGAACTSSLPHTRPSMQERPRHPGCLRLLCMLLQGWGRVPERKAAPKDPGAPQPPSCSDRATPYI